MNIGENLRKARVDRGLSQKTVANAIGISNSSLSDYETGRCQPSLKVYMSLMDFYQIDPMLFLQEHEMIDITHLSKFAKLRIFKIIEDDNKNKE